MPKVLATIIAVFAAALAMLGGLWLIYVRLKHRVDHGGRGRTAMEYVKTSVEIPASLQDDLNKLGELLGAANAILELGQRILGRLNEQRAGTGFRSDLEAAFYVVFGKSFKTCNSIQILCRSGCGADAFALCGSLFENMVDLLYMRQDEKRASNYLAFEQVDKYYQVEKILKRKDLSPEDTKRYQGYLTELAPQVQNSLSMFPAKSCWSRPGRNGSKHHKILLKERAEETNLGAEYDKMYSILCAFKHTASSAASGFMFQHDEGVDVILGPNVKGVYGAALHSARYFLDVCGIFQDAFGLKMEPEVRELERKLSEASHQVLRENPAACE